VCGFQQKATQKWPDFREKNPKTESFAGVSRGFLQIWTETLGAGDGKLRLEIEKFQRKLKKLRVGIENDGVG
jgi:hypothetical protein